jgi:hypothetical protein
MVVKMKPLGSLVPGVINFARTPAMKPIKMVHRIPIPASLIEQQRVSV